MTKFKVTVALLVALSLALYIVFELTFETNNDRRRIAAKIEEYARRFENDPSDNQSLDKIRAILNGDWSFARTYACGALRRLGTKAARAIPDLIEALESGDPFVEREAARALGSVGVGRQDAVWPLINKLQYEDDDVGWFAASSLAEIGLPAVPAIPYLERAAKSKNDLMAEDAVKALKELKGLRDHDER